MIMATTTPLTALERNKIISARFIKEGITTEAFIAGTLTPAELNGYLTSVAPFEDYSNPIKKTLWDEALAKSKEMMSKAGQKPIAVKST